MANDFSKGSVKKNIVSQAVPLVFAQIAQLLYSVVDRIYIGHLPESDSMALTGIGLVFPITTLIAAFTNLFGMGGTPLFAIARGAKDEEKAKKILGNTFLLLLISSGVLLGACYIFREPVLFLFGASENSYVYADDYLKIYLVGTPFLMLSTGLNGFINAQGFPKIGMLTTTIGAALNLALDPLFIFAFEMGVKGAAIATVISQIVSALWVLKFLTGKKALLKIQRKYLKIDLRLTGKIASLG
ncbi:MAG: MATE family efflux transporter, partial [Oscillospiraceae bacterium]|nr:MATE family efflux transporter [Oscillospiraceae bacterium]